MWLTSVKVQKGRRRAGSEKKKTPGVALEAWRTGVDENDEGCLNILFVSFLF